MLESFIGNIPLQEEWSRYYALYYYAIMPHSSFKCELDKLDTNGKVGEVFFLLSDFLFLQFSMVYLH